MQTIKLNDEIYNELHILTKAEYSKNQYRGVNASTGERFAFLSGYGTILFFEYKHYLVIDNKKPLKAFAIFRNHNTIGYCYLPEETAKDANKHKNAIFYFGSDAITKKANGER